MAAAPVDFSAWFDSPDNSDVLLRIVVRGEGERDAASPIRSYYEASIFSDKLVAGGGDAGARGGAAKRGRSPGAGAAGDAPMAEAPSGGEPAVVRQLHGHRVILQQVRGHGGGRGPRGRRRAASAGSPSPAPSHAPSLALAAPAGQRVVSLPHEPGLGGRRGAAGGC
jgi:hypothetical protein